MTDATFPARFKTIALVLILTVVVAGCADVRRGVSWPALDTVSVNGTTVVIVAYEKQIELINPDLPLSLVDNETDTGWLIKGGDYDDAQFFTAPMMLEDDGETALLFPTYNNKMLEFDLESGAPATTIGIDLKDGVIAAPVMTADLIYIPYRNEDLVALDTQDYTEQWRIDTEGGVWSSPILVEDVLYFTSIDHHLYAVNAVSGQALWTVDLEGAAAASPLYHDGFLYVGSYSHKMFKIDLNGQIVATYEDGKNWIWSTPVIAGDILYYTDLSGTVYALNTNNLSEVWSNTVANSGNARGIRPAPLVTDKYIVVASRNGTVYWLGREDGQVIFEREVDGKPELLSDMLLLEAGTVEGVNTSLVVVGSTDTKRLVAFFQLDTSQPYGVYNR